MLRGVSLLRDLDLALAERHRAGAAGGTRSRTLAEGEGWQVLDVLCTSGPDDRSYQEQHERVGIALVAAGSFTYRSASGRVLLVPGSFLLGNAGQDFECGHEHGRGDRCISFQFEPQMFERLAADAGARPSDRRFRTPRLPPVRHLSRFVARAAVGAAGARSVSWEELAVGLAGAAVELAAGLSPGGAPVPAGLEARVAQAARRIEAAPDAEHTLASLGRAMGASPWHCLRAFERVTGVTPHQFVLRTRVRAAALALGTARSRVLDVAYGAGFGDLSNFNRTFRAEVGTSPTIFRRTLT
jgi:AraC family transcriptional regulator